MHNNYYFIKQLSKSLSARLKGKKLLACFSQNRDELVLGFGHEEGAEFYIKAHLSGDFSCLYFPEKFARAKKNNVNLFGEVLDRPVTHIRQYLNERAFSVHFRADDENDYSLLFKLHGNRSNIILCRDGKSVSLFKKKLVKDQEINLDRLDRAIDQSQAAFLTCEQPLKSLFPTFGKLPLEWLKDRGYYQKEKTEQWELVEELLILLNSPKYYLCTISNKLYVSLLPMGTVEQAFSEPLEAVNTFFLTYIRKFSTEKEKGEILKQLQKKAKQTENYISKTEQKLNRIEHEMNWQLMGDLVMAHMHHIPEGTEKVTLNNFYTGEPVKIKLNKQLPPQKNAENFYRKAKNQKIEVRELKENLHNKEEQLLSIYTQIDDIQTLDDVKSIRQYIRDHELEKTSKGQQQAVPYRKFMIEGYDILVGKSARHNDDLIREYAWKEDLWLHAKDVPGSHVLVKQIPGKKIPNPVLEKAAQLAAWFSKRKTDTLCPVIYTPKKYVRKAKGLDPGQVIVEKEEVIMVEPALIH